MKLPLVFLAAGAAMLLSACTKKPAAAPVVDSSGTPAAASATLPPPPPSVTANAQNAPAQSVEGEVHPFLTQQLQIFVKQKGRMPNSFAELAATRLDSTPRPPAGSKWVIDTAAMQVKAVKSQ